MGFPGMGPTLKKIFTPYQICHKSVDTITNTYTNKITHMMTPTTALDRVPGCSMLGRFGIYLTLRKSISFVDIY